MDYPPDPELEAAAEEELALAAEMDWAALAGLVPWGDTYEGFGPSGGPLVFERGYLWNAEAGGDILCEVIAHRGPSRYHLGARRSVLIRRPAGEGARGDLR
jgi:hypothetical protein